MSKIKSIIIDDEASARRSLQAYVDKYCEQVVIVGQAEKASEAYELILLHKPDLVFLDIEMPGGNAFDLLDQFEKIEFEIIFITAYSDYAVRAFELSAAHYLLKPVSIDELVNAVDKVRHKLINSDELASARVLVDNLRTVEAQAQKIVLPLIDGFELVGLSTIVYISAMDNFSQVHLVDGRRVTVCRKLKYFEEYLSEFGFFRIHRSHLINREFISRYHKGKGGYVTLATGKQLDVAQSRKKEFLEKFGIS